MFFQRDTAFFVKLKKVFTPLALSKLIKFDSVHAIRIYELLKQYRNIAKKTLKIEDIKKCCGVEDKFKQYGRFEQNILLRSQKDMKEKSDINFSFKKIKQGRKPVAINFLVCQNEIVMFTK